MSAFFIKNIDRLNFSTFLSQEEAARSIVDNWFRSKNSMVVNYVYYANYVLLRRSDEYARSLLFSDYILPDGIGMAIYFKKVLGKKIKSLNLTDLNSLFLKVLTERNTGIALYGTTHKSIESCVRKLRQKNKDNNIYYYQDGFSSLDWNAIKPDTALLIGLGTPRQEVWIKDNHRNILSKNLLVISVGGFFDFCSGFYKRAPELWRKCKLEWLWRLILHPGLHYKKNLRNLSIFYYPYVDKFNSQIRKLNIKKYP